MSYYYDLLFKLFISLFADLPFKIEFILRDSVLININKLKGWPENGPLFYQNFYSKFLL